MSDPLSIRCPACKARLTLKSRNQQGRKISCPKCGKPFVVPAPKTTDDEDDALFSQLDEQDSATEEVERRLPPPRRSTGSGGKKPGRSARPPWVVPGLIGGGVLAAIGIVLAIVVSSGWLQNKPVGDGGQVAGAGGAATAPDSPAPVAVAEIEPPSRQEVKGKWTDADDWVLSPTDPVAVLQLAERPPEEYTVSLRARRLTGKNTFAIGLPVPGGLVLLALETNSATASGLELLDGKRVAEIESSYRGRLLLPDHETVITCTVRKDAITCTCGDVKVVDWKGDFRKLSLPSDLAVPDKKAVFLATMGSSVAVRDIKVSVPESAITTTPDVASATSAKLRNSVGMELVLIQPGKFKMGEAATGFVDVTLTKPFQMATTEVTQGQWRSVMRTTPWKGQDNLREGDRYPATNMSWTEAVAFCKKLSETEHAWYRLPTEAEWEYACRGGTTTKLSFGDDESQLGEYAWYLDNTFKVGEGHAHEVAKKKPNPFGLFDMYGNVFEWCADACEARRLKLPGGIDPLETDGTHRVQRGGAWDQLPYTMYGGYWQLGGEAAEDIGFRVCRSAGPPVDTTIAEATLASTAGDRPDDFDLGKPPEIIDRFPLPKAPPFVSQIDGVQPDGTVQVVPPPKDKVELPPPGQRMVLAKGHYLGIVAPLGEGAAGLLSGRLLRVAVLDASGDGKAKLQIAKSAVGKIKAGEGFVIFRPTGKTSDQLKELPEIVSLEDFGRTPIDAPPSSILLNKSLRNLQSIGLAMQLYENVHRSYPPAAFRGPDGKLWHSWRVMLLPYLEGLDTYNLYKWDEPWDGPNNRKLLDKMPKEYADPVNGENKEFFTNYVVIKGERASFAKKGAEFDGTEYGIRVALSDHRSRFADLRDPIVVAGHVGFDRKIPWMKPEDVVVEDGQPMFGPRGFAVLPFKTAKGRLAPFLLADGRVYGISRSIDDKLLRSLFTISGRQNVDWSTVPYIGLDNLPIHSERDATAPVIYLVRVNGEIKARLVMEPPKK